MPGKAHGWKSLVGYSPWGREESDTTEQPHMECYLPGFLSPEFKSVTSAGWHFSFIRLSFTEGLIEKATRGEREREKKRDREMPAV